jgi:hypothetical protein
MHPRRRHLPVLDPQHRALAAATIKKYARLAGFPTNPEAYAKRIAESILPDAVPHRVGSKARYGVGRKRRVDRDAEEHELSFVAEGRPSA